MNYVVVKFGGTSVADPASWKTIAQLVTKYGQDGLRPVIVCSALSGISALLAKLVELALTGNYQSCLTTIKDRHFEFAKVWALNAAEILAEDFS